MAENSRARAYLVLENGTVFPGVALGADGETIGEVVFNTCEASYQSVLQDPSYYGQLIAQTFPLVGNRGVYEEQAPVTGEQTSIRANGYIVREWCNTPSELDFGLTLDEYLRKQSIVGISGIDTRRLTRCLRGKGYCKGAITQSLNHFDDLLTRIAAFSVSGAVADVSVKQALYVTADHAKYHVVIPDFGFPRAMLTSLLRRGCNVTIVPAETSADEIKSRNPDGILLPDGPADPDDNPKILRNIKAMTALQCPILGIGVGHQMLALAAGGIVGEMPQGHRGSNQPVRVVGSDRVLVTMQNHAYDVADGSLSTDEAVVTMRNTNDDSVEGLRYLGFPGISVQFVPQDDALYCDTAFVWDDFIALMQHSGEGDVHVG